MVNVSVLVPNYNHGPYLKQRLDSILQQSFQDFELIVIDDCSTDNSRAILEQYREHPKVSQLIYNKTNSGSPFGNWKKGIELARGPYIWIAESDDWAHPLFLEKTVALLDAYPNAGIAYTDSYIVGNDSEQLGTWKAVKNEKLLTDKWSNNYFRTGVEELLENMLIFMTINNMSACLFRKNALPDMVDVVPLKGAGDWLFCALMLLKHGIVYYAEPLSYYRTHPENVTKHNDKSGLLLVENMLFYAIVLTELKHMHVDLTGVLPSILDRYLYKYVNTFEVSIEKRQLIRQHMLRVSVAFFIRFNWLLTKYRIKQFFN